ncbi:hypothetical protein ACFPRL_26275 [Pseudoclavibacter helvolus]
MASASSVTAPMGVLSSWLTFATKSRRTLSTRSASVRSSASTRKNLVERGAARTRTWISERPNGPRAISRSLVTASPCLLASSTTAPTRSSRRPPGRTSPFEVAPGDDW